MSLITLLDSVNEDINGEKNGPGPLISGSWILTIKATSFGGGFVALQLSDDNGSTWITPTINGIPAEFTANTMVKVDYIPAEFAVRAILDNSTDASNVTATLAQTT